MNRIEFDPSYDCIGKLFDLEEDTTCFIAEHEKNSYQLSLFPQLI